MSETGVQHVEQWRTARFITGDDIVSTSHAPIAHPGNATPRLVILPPGVTAIAMRVIGSDTDNQTGTLRIKGWMDDRTKNGSGPGQTLFDVAVILGSESLGSTAILTDGMWPAATYLEADTFTAVGASDPGISTTIGDTDESNLIILPTLGYTQLDFQMTVGTAITLGVIWRPIYRGPGVNIPLLS